MDIGKLFDGKSKQLFWRAIDPAHLIGVSAPREIEPGKAYFTIRLSEMYLAAARKAWHQIYPMLHCFTQVGGSEVHNIASPAQLQDLGDLNLDRIVNLNVRLFGPMPYNGEEVSILAGLYAIPSHDGVKVLIDFVSSVAALDPATVTAAVSLASLIKTGVENILGLNQATLELGIRDSFSPSSRPLRGGYFVGIGAAAQTIDASQLWVVNGRLLKGKDAGSAVPYSDHDYLLLAVEAANQRDDWAQLAVIQDYRKRFSTIVGDAQYNVAEKRSRLAALWPLFVQALSDVPDLIDPDKDRIANVISDELLKKLKVQDETNPFLKVA